MFKKPIKIAAHNSLSGKDKKTLKTDLAKLFDPVSVDLLLEKNKEYIVEKVQGAKTLVFKDEVYPLFVDATSKGDYFPTIYACQLCPNLLKAVEINEKVDQFLFNGANLMWPGVKNLDTIGEFKADDVRLIRTFDGKVIAVGAMACSSDQLKKSGPQGTAVFILHLIDDKLYELGPKTPAKSLIEEPKKEDVKVEEVPVKDKEVKAKDEKPKEDKAKAKEEKPKEDKTKAKEEKGKGDKKNVQKKQKESEEEEDEDEEEEDLSAFTTYFGVGKKPAQAKPQPSAGTGASKPIETQSKVTFVDDKQKKKNVFDDEEVDKKKRKGGKKGAKGKSTEEQESDEEDDKGKGKGKQPKKDEKGKKGDKDNKDNKGKKQGKKAKKDESEEEEEEEEDEDHQEEQEEVPSKGEANTKKEGKAGEEEKEEVKEGSIPTKIMDEYLFEAFLTALKISVNDKDLPLDAGEFYSDHMLPCKRENVFIDIKNSSYKKLGKFLQAMNKLDLIEYKESKKGAAPQITKIIRSNSKLAEFEPAVAKATKKEKEEEVNEEDKWPKVEIQELYKPKPSLAFFFPDNEDKNKYYTKEEIQAVILKYINENKLLERKNIRLDARLMPLWEESKVAVEPQNEGGEEGENKPKSKDKYMPRDHIFNKLDDNLNAFHKITELATGKSEFKNGKFKGINMVAEKAHNKNITRIQNLESFGFNIPHIVNKFQLKYACSVSTHTLQEKNVEKKEVIVHGNFLQELLDYFTDECKIDKKYITYINKLEKKKK